MRQPEKTTTEAGFILPTVVIVVFIVTLLAGTAITVAMQSSTSTTRDNNVKAALAAAESGLQVATYRVNQLKPKENQCINSSEDKEEPCESSWESLGNGANFRYQTTKALSAGEKCAGQTIVAKTGITQRCVTSEGKVNGVEPYTRLKARIESAVGESLFSVRGILGLEEVLVSGSVKATAVVTSNKKIKGEGSAAFEKGFEICPEGKFEPAAGKERNKSGVTVHGVGGEKTAPEYEKTRSASECPIIAKIPIVHANAAENEDTRIGSGEDPNTGEAAHLQYTAATFGLEVGAKVNLTLKGSKYYFCKFLATNDGIVKIAPGTKAEIFIDTHANNPSCPSSGSGVFKIEGNAHLENPNGPASLLIEVAGPGPVAIENSGSLNASIYAPEAEVVLSGSGTLTGAIVGNKIHLTAGSFIFSEEDEALTVGGSGAGAYSRQRWQQCTAGSSGAQC